MCVFAFVFACFVSFVMSICVDCLFVCLFAFAFSSSGVLCVGLVCLLCVYCLFDVCVLFVCVLFVCVFVFCFVVCMCVRLIVS